MSSQIQKQHPFPFEAGRDRPEFSLLEMMPLIMFDLSA